jgi:ligand-binding SRPBCC domain-containing protein
MSTKIYTLRREQLLPIPIEQAWAFFSSAKNLAEITPAEMKFVILTQLTDEPIYSGMKIDYTVSPLLNVPLKWTTEITGVNAPVKFTDKQLKGPYKQWIHTHTFTSVPGGVRMEDEVQYSLPLGIAGPLIHSLIVKNKLEEIFDFRKKRLELIFGKFKN